MARRRRRRAALARGGQRRYLAHVRDAWDARFPKFPLAEQDFVLTLPASFDEVARELTVKAAALAGLPRVVLIEEPQAAFYAWIYAHSENWERLVQPGQKILVCDIGGGTSDFTLIRVRRGEGGKVQFHRVAVGEHLILGGDNLDLALAHHLEQRLTGAGDNFGRCPACPAVPCLGALLACQQCRCLRHRQDTAGQASSGTQGGSSSRGTGPCWCRPAAGSRKRCWAPTPPSG